MKKTFITLLLLTFLTSLFSESYFSEYFGKTFHGCMLGKIITADMTFFDEEEIEFIVNLPSGKKAHKYLYKVIEESDSGIISEWYENGKFYKRVTFSELQKDCFQMEIKGKGKIQMKVKN